MLKGISFISIKNFLSKKKGNYSFYPSRDWKLIIFFFSAVNLFFAVLLYFLYLDIKKEEFKGYIPPNDQQEIFNFDRALFDQIVSEHKNKSFRLEQLKEEEAERLDPEN